MSNHQLTVKAFLDTIKNLSFFSRLFGWSKVKRELVDAATALASLQNELINTQQNLTATTLQLSVLQETKRNLEIQLQSYTNDLSIYKERTLNCEREIQAVREENVQLKKEEEFRSQKYSEEIVSLQV
jgi:predicted  nucleic acid-binding Zn-ribbon protein